MKLLFDENVSPKLVEVLADKYPGSAHVTGEGLRRADDQRIWEHAREHAFAFVSKDIDFRERSFVEGFPPKVIWLDVGHRGLAAAAASAGRELRNASEAALLILSIGPSPV